MAENGFISKLKSSVSDSSSKKLMIFAGVTMVAAIGYAMVPTSTSKPAPSNVISPPVGESRQGGDVLTQKYDSELANADRKRIEDARLKGDTAMPTIRLKSQNEQPILLPEPAKEPKQPPTVETPKPPVIEQVPVINPSQIRQVPIVTPVQPIQSPQDIQKVSDSLAQLVRRPAAVAEVQYLYDEKSREVAVAANSPQSAPVVPGNQSSKSSKIKLPLAGSILYATLVGRANSDAPGPVVAKILQGPYAGATLVGGFTTGRDALVIKFTKMSVGTSADGEEINETINVDAVAVDTKNIGTPLATSVDRHLLEKLGIGLGASFAQGFGQAVAQKNSSSVLRSDGSYTTTTTQLSTKDQLLSAGGQSLSSAGNILMDEFGRRPTTIIVDSGTPIGILFL